MLIDLAPAASTRLPAVRIAYYPSHHVLNIPHLPCQVEGSAARTSVQRIFRQVNVPLDLLSQPVDVSRQHMRERPKDVRHA